MLQSAYAVDGASPAVNPLINLLPIFFIFFIFYFLLIRPQKKQQQEHKKMLEGLKKNDEVITTGGIHGVIVNVKDTTFVIKVDDNAKLEVEKSAVAKLKK